MMFTLETVSESILTTFPPATTGVVSAFLSLEADAIFPSISFNLSISCSIGAVSTENPLSSRFLFASTVILRRTSSSCNLACISFGSFSLISFTTKRFLELSCPFVISMRFLRLTSFPCVRVFFIASSVIFPVFSTSFMAFSRLLVGSNRFPSKAFLPSEIAAAIAFAAASSLMGKSTFLISLSEIRFSAVKGIPWITIHLAFCLEDSSAVSSPASSITLSI